jgi:hypothetical protein
MIKQIFDKRRTIGSEMVFFTGVGISGDFGGAGIPIQVRLFFERRGSDRPGSRTNFSISTILSTTPFASSR